MSAVGYANRSPIHINNGEDEAPRGNRPISSSVGEGDTRVDVNRPTEALACFQGKCLENLRPPMGHEVQTGAENMQSRVSSRLGRRIGSIGRRHNCLIHRYKGSVILLALLSLAGGVNGFHAWIIKGCDGICRSRYAHERQPCFMTAGEDDRGNERRNPDDDMFGEDLDTGAVLIEELSWRVEKMRLEEQNTQRFLKARPRFLPYEECRKWVQALGRWKTEEDWRQWIGMGEKRNAYIPSKPDEYYGRLGQW